MYQKITYRKTTILSNIIFSQYQHLIALFILMLHTKFRHLPLNNLLISKKSQRNLKEISKKSQRNLKEYNYLFIPQNYFYFLRKSKYRELGISDSWDVLWIFSVAFFWKI